MHCVAAIAACFAWSYRRSVALPGPADRILHARRIYTRDGGPARAIALREGRIIDVSDSAAGLDALRRTVNGDGLSPRETEVLRSIALGYTSAEIAQKLHLSRRTIETHRANIHRKLGLATRAELVHFALRRHLIGVSPPAANAG